MLHIAAKLLKITCVLDAAAVALIPMPNGQPKVALSIAVGSRVVRAEVNAKSLRRCIAEFIGFRGKYEASIGSARRIHQSSGETGRMVEDPYQTETSSRTIEEDPTNTSARS